MGDLFYRCQHVQRGIQDDYIRLLAVRLHSEQTLIDTPEFSRRNTEPEVQFSTTVAEICSVELKGLQLQGALRQRRDRCGR